MEVEQLEQHPQVFRLLEMEIQVIDIVSNSAEIDLDSACVAVDGGEVLQIECTGLVLLFFDLLPLDLVAQSGDVLLHSLRLELLHIHLEVPLLCKTHKFGYCKFGFTLYLLLLADGHQLGSDESVNMRLEFDFVFGDVVLDRRVVEVLDRVAGLSHKMPLDLAPA